MTVATAREANASGTEGMARSTGMAESTLAISISGKTETAGVMGTVDIMVLTPHTMAVKKRMLGKIGERVPAVGAIMPAKVFKESMEKTSLGLKMTRKPRENRAIQVATRVGKAAKPMVAKAAVATLKTRTTREAIRVVERLTKTQIANLMGMAVKAVKRATTARTEAGVKAGAAVRMGKETQIKACRTVEVTERAAGKEIATIRMAKGTVAKTACRMGLEGHWSHPGVLEREGR